MKETIENVNSLSSILADKEANLVNEINAAFDELAALIEARRKYFLSELESKSALKQASLGKSIDTTILFLKLSWVLNLVSYLN